MRWIGPALLTCFVQFFTALSAQAALPPEVEASIKRFIQKSPSVNGLRVELEFM